MSDVVRHSAGAVVTRLPGGRAMVTGTDVQVGLALDALRRRGLLIGADDPKPLGDGRVILTCRLLQPVQRAPEPPRRRLSRRAWAAIAGGVLAVVGLAAWLAYEVLVLIIDHAMAIIGMLLFVGLLLLGAGRACVTHITVRHHH